MQPSERIEIIKSLNDLGMRLATMPTMPQAEGIHNIAAQLASSTNAISIDYLLVSTANQAYALRQLGNYRAAERILNSALGQPLLPERIRTYGGRGRVYEELGIVTADMPLPQEEPVSTRIRNIQTGLSQFEKALSDYDQAFKDPSAEIYTPAQLTQRRLRTIGMRSPKARDLYELVTDGQEKKAWLTKAVAYATEEVQGREALGETSGQNLATAYHTLGQALTETVVDNRDNYIRAKILFDRVADTPGVHVNTLTTMNLRRAWLEYRRDPAAKEAIIPLFDAFLADTSSLTGADKNALNRRVQELGRHLGGEYVKKVEGFYVG